MPKFKNQYRIERHERYPRGSFYQVGIKLWYWPFWQILNHQVGVRSPSTPLCLFFNSLEDKYGFRTLFKDGCFYTQKEAEAFANDYAIRGDDAWVIELKPNIDVVKELGKLP